MKTGFSPGRAIAMGVAIMACIGLSTGCVSKNIQPASIPVSTTQNNKGLVALSWKSKVGYNYQLVSRDLKTRTMVVGRKIYEGTGDMITVEFMLDPRRNLPEYSVLATLKGK